MLFKDLKEREGFQINLIKETLSCCKNTEIYKNKDLLHSITTKEDLSSIPFTTKEDLRKHYPFGTLATDFENIIETHMSSGSTGKPTLSFYTAKDLERSSTALAQSWANFGITSSSRVQFCMSYGLYTGAALNTLAIQHLGAFVLPAGIQSTSKQVSLLQDFQIDTMVATPSYYLHFIDYLKLNNIDRNSLNLRVCIVAGEVYSLEIKAQIKKELGVEVYDHYGLCEVNTGIIYECKECGQMAVLDDHVYAEVLDINNQRPVAEREEGELVLTSLEKEATPILRYRTGDVVTFVSNFSRCRNCFGNTLVSRIKSKVGNTIFYKGIKVEPNELRDMIFVFAGGKIFNRIKFIIPQDLFKDPIKVLLASRMEDSSDLIKEIETFVKEKTKVTVSAEIVPYSYFEDFTSTKEKIVQYA